MNNQSCPLVPHESAGNGIPSLGCDETDEDFLSPLERLITESTAEQRGDNSSNFAGTINNNNYLYNNDGHRINSSRRLDSRARKLSSPSVPLRGSFLMLAACTCCFLQIFFLWTSFVSSSWLDTRLIFSIPIPSIQEGNHEEILLHSITLGSLISGLLKTERHWAAIFLVLITIMIPCFCAICGIFGILDYQKTILAANRNNCRVLTKWNNYYPRIIIEYIGRISFSIIFMISTIDIGTSSSTEIEMNGLKLIVINQIKGGMVTFCLGMLCSLLVFVLLRLGISNTDAIINHKSINGRKSCKEMYRLSDKRVSRNTYSTTVIPIKPSNAYATLSLWKRIIIYELFLLTQLLWLPALRLPLFQLRFDGIIFNFTPDKSTVSIRLWDFPALFWEQSVSAESYRWMPILVGLPGIVLIFVCPFVANILAIGSWVCDLPMRLRCKNILLMIQPFLGSIIFCVSVFFSVPVFEAVTESLTNKGYCPTDTCFAIQGQRSMGLILLMFQAVALELFVLVTIYW